MVITNNFIFLHYPKTGGTFCETHIRRLYQQTNRQKLVNLLRAKPIKLFRELRRHKGVHAIPRCARHLEIVSCIRNPYDRWVSQFEFKIYKYFPDEIHNLDLIKDEYPHFPNVSFPEYVKITNKFLNKVQNKFEKAEEQKIGYYSAQFIGMFCLRPADILKLPKVEITAELVHSKMASNVTFLQTSNLNKDLYDYLSRFKHDTADLETILDSPPILPEKSGSGSLRPEGAWRTYYNQETVEIINDKESLIFELFPQFKVESYDESWQMPAVISGESV